MSANARFDLATEFVAHGPILTHDEHGAVVLTGCACDKPLPLARETSGPDWTNFALHMAEIAETVRALACTCDPVPLSCNGEGPSETCEIHGRTYAEWVERGDILTARLAAVKDVIAKARKTPAANDPYHVALDIADDLDAAVYLDSLPGQGRVLDLPPESVECCASGRCEVCSPGFDWGRDG